jgi:NAD(P)H-hydrate epimerase
MRIPVVRVSEQTSRAELAGYFEKTDVVVDALFGIGLKKPLAGMERTVVETVNATCRGRVVAVDIPSGLDGDTGEVLGAAIKATHTATLACPKKGLLIGQGPQHSGKIGVIPIGIPRQELGE